MEAVREYFASSDAAEVARRLEELGEPGLHNILVKLVLTLQRTARICTAPTGSLFAMGLAKGA